MTDYLTPDIRSAFKSDYDLPFPLERVEKAFEAYLGLFNFRYGCKSLWKNMSRLVEECGSPEKFLELRKQSLEKIKAELKSRKASVVPGSWFSKPYACAMYARTAWLNAGVPLVALSLKNANFQVLRRSGLVSENSWEELIGKVCPGLSGKMAEYVRASCESASARKSAFRSLEFRGLAEVQRSLVQQVVEFLESSEEIEIPGDICSVSDEDVVLKVGELWTSESLRSLERAVLSGTGVEISARSFEFMTVQFAGSSGGAVGFISRSHDSELRVESVPEPFAPLAEAVLLRLAEFLLYTPWKEARETALKDISAELGNISFPPEAAWFSCSGLTCSLVEPLQVWVGV